MYLLNAPDLVICLFKSELIWLDSPSFLYNMTGLQQVLARLVAGHPSGLLGSAWLTSLRLRTVACYSLHLRTGPDSYLRLLGVGKFFGRWQDRWTIVCFKVGRSA